MKPLAAVIAAFASLKDELYTRFNAALGKLPPMEQIEAGQGVLSVVREVDWAKERMERVGQDLEATLTAAAEKLAGFEKKAGESLQSLAARVLDASLAEAASAAIAAAIAAKSVIPMDEHTTILASETEKATKQGAADAEIAFNAKLSDLNTLAERRKDAVDKFGALAAASLSDAALLAESYPATIAILEGRLASIAAAGITAEARPLGFASLLAVALDESAATEFDGRLGALKEVQPAAAPLSASTQKPTPSTPAPTLTPTASTEVKKTII